MARTPAGLGGEARVTDYISLGVIMSAFPEKAIRTALAETGRSSIRERELPAHVVMYYVIAQALLMQVSQREVLRCLLEGMQWLFGPQVAIKVTGKSGISQARSRLGWEPVKQLHDKAVAPIAVKQTRGAWYRNWKLVSLDGSTLNVADTQENRAAFGRPGASCGSGVYPQIRFVSIVENGTHILFGTALASYATGEITLAKAALKRLKSGMLCLADRNFLGYELWRQAQATGADLLWRGKKHLRLEREKELPDGSYLSRLFPSERDGRKKTNGIRVRVIEYRLEGIPQEESSYRLVTTILDHRVAPVAELAALYHERCEIETALDELKTPLRSMQIVLRSKTPDLVKQEFYGFLMAHFAVRGLMHEAALKADEDPDQLSFLHAVRVIRRKLPAFGANPPSAGNGFSSSSAG
jgi:Insertion element 4 transposase N-terminal/Transposase DDE domain